LLTEKSNSTNVTHSENASGKIDIATITKTAGETSSHERWRSNHEEAAFGRLLALDSVVVDTAVGLGA
jgi:hypothetical protein